MRFSVVFSRRLYLEFTLGQSQEHWLGCHQNAWTYFGGVCAEVMVDNCKTAVLEHRLGQPPLFHPRYLDLAHHYGFVPKACGPRRPQQKGRVESAVGYVKGNFLSGLDLSGLSLEALNAAARLWLDQVANRRVHAQTRKTPMELFDQELPHLRALRGESYPVGVLSTARVSARCRVTVDTNRYSVPPEHAGRILTLKLEPARLALYHQDVLVAEHLRSYDRHQDFQKPEHVVELLLQRRQARDQQLLARFLALSPQATAYFKGLEEKRANPLVHVRQIVALSEIYKLEEVQRALEDSLVHEAVGADYVANLLQQRARPAAQPGALHLTRQQDLLDLDLPQPDLSLYERGGSR